ncbi:hypothetical protein JTE90_028466 [Oedothorax gibbosus]|uniref:LysM domain-containing protein n=1 Tax=Oedothorax gibbosus TaxID=931172 RepID=A0AAV6VHD2_9ARAC|nr:hypothetical protein JTE90_028466 [Oedothorax gibbosus]
MPGRFLGSVPGDGGLPVRCRPRRDRGPCASDFSRLPGESASPGTFFNKCIEQRTPTRQRSLRERLQSASRGIGISWQGKKSKSCYSKESLGAQSSESETDVKNDETNRDEENASKSQDTEESSIVAEKKPLGRSLTQPQGTEHYKVANSDTLAGIAARFDTTPSELAKLNRLSARMVFPGQQLFVPEKKNKGTEEEGGGEGQESSDSLQPPPDFDREERRPSVTDNLRIPYRRASERAHRFLKVKARHFTDGQGVVSGVLIITPNAVMFDPNVSDPLVIEHGVESYGVIAPLEMLMRAAIYFDIAHMKVAHAADTQGPRPKADVYCGKMNEDTVEEEAEEDTKGPPIDEKAPSIEVVPEADTTTTEASPPPPPEEAKEVAPPPENTAADESSEDAKVETPPKSKSEGRGSVESFDEEVSDAFAASEEKAQEAPSQESRRERMLKRLSCPMESITSISRILTSSPKSFVDFSGSLFSGGKSASEDGDILEKDEEKTEEKEKPEKEEGVGYQNLVAEKPEIFEQLDKLLLKQKEEVEGPPLYLCLRMGIPKERKPHPSPVLSYGKKRARSEYWWSIPRSRVEDLYSFLQQWIPTLYGEVDDVDPDEAGFVPIDDSAPDEEEDEETEGKDEASEEGDKEAPRSFLKLVEEHFGFKSISPGDWEVRSIIC